MAHAWTRRVVVALGALLVATAASAQYREYYVRGKVLDPQKAPIAGVLVRMVDTQTSRSFDTRTDKDGIYKLAGLPHAVYQVSFTRDGYVSKQDKWDFSALQERMKKIELPDLVMASVEQAQRAEVLKATESGVKEATEKLRAGDADGAIALLQGVLQKKPDDPAALFFLGLGYARKKMYREALVPLTRVTELAPSLVPRAQFEIGVCERELGDREKALAAFEAALRLEPTNADAAYNAGLILFETGRGEEALARFEQGLAQKPADPDLLEMAGRCYVQQGKLREALERLEKARAAHPDPAKVAFLDELIAKLKTRVDAAPR